MQDGCRVIQEYGFSNVIVLHIMGEESEVRNSNNYNECNSSDEDFRIFCDLLKCYNVLPFCLVFVTSIFRCK